VYLKIRINNKLMAFVYRSERKIELSGKENNTLLGPGRYIAH